MTQIKIKAENETAQSIKYLNIGDFFIYGPFTYMVIEIHNYAVKAMQFENKLIQTFDFNVKVKKINKVTLTCDF